MINIATKDLVDPEMVGYLLKIGGSYVSKKVWRKRWFILKDFVLYYFKTPGVFIYLFLLILIYFGIHYSSLLFLHNFFLGFCCSWKNPITRLCSIFSR